MKEDRETKAIVRVKLLRNADRERQGRNRGARPMEG